MLGIRPEGFAEASGADPVLPQIDVQVEVVEELGSDTHALFRIAASRVETDDVTVTLDGERAVLSEDRALFDARVDPRLDPRPGDMLRLAVDPRAFHFFDLEPARTSVQGRALRRPRSRRRRLVDSHFCGTGPRATATGGRRASWASPTESRSTTNTSGSCGLITPPAPRAP